MNTIHRLHLADVVYPESHPRSGVGPVYAFAVATNAGTVLVDTGIGPPQALIDENYRPTRYPLDAALRVAGIERSSVVAIVNSHLHFDHCGNNAAFPGVPVWVQAAEREAARTTGYTIPEFVENPAIQYRLIEGEEEVVPGACIVPTPGHTPGHQSLVVQQDDGLELIAAQAFETIEEFVAARTEGAAVRDYPSIAELVGSLTAVHVSHDHRVWRALR